MEDLLNNLLQWLQNVDFGSFDLLDASAYGAVFLGLLGSYYAAFKNTISPLWDLVEDVVGFVISTLVVFSIWYAILRVHVSVSFNLDKELFDNLLWVSAITFTPFYLVKYNLFEQSVIFFVRFFEMMLDLFVFSWFEDRATANRAKWKQRFDRWGANFFSFLPN